MSELRRKPRKALPLSIAERSELRNTAAELMAGMLAHPTRYCPRGPGAYAQGHQALAREALDMAEALLSEINNRSETP